MTQRTVAILLARDRIEFFEARAHPQHGAPIRTTALPVEDTRERTVRVDADLLVLPMLIR